MSRLLALTLALAALAAVVAGCGDDDDDDGGGSGSAENARLVVSAAASMTEALEACAPEFGEQEGVEVRLSFAGSDELAAQIRQGVKPDVYAAANTRLPDELYDEGLVEKPVEFATNTFVLAVPEDSDIDSIEDLTRGRGQARDRLGVGADRLNTRARRSPSCRRARRRRSSTTCARTSRT